MASFHPQVALARPAAASFHPQVALVHLVVASFHLQAALARPLVVVPILRAGLGMLQPFQDVFPDISVGYIGLERDHETAVARSYYCKLPPLENARTIVVDPMLATGGSASRALSIVKECGAKDVSLACIIAAPEGVEAVERAHPEVPIILGVLDSGLDARRYIIPGLGDFGDRLYGTHA